MMRIGRYEIESELGAGGMAAVYLATDPLIKRQVAIKVMSYKFTNDSLVKAFFYQEAEAIAALEHPAIVPIYDFGQHGKQPYIVMRHMPNGTLFDRIIAGNLTPADLYHVIERVASALDEAHGQGIVHRDVKLSNILFDNAHHACLADFGLAKFAQRTTGVTGTLFIGSPEYMSPEQVRRERVDGRTDIYALGVVLFLALTNQFPYKGRSPAKTAMAHLTAPIPSVRTAKPDLPDMWDEIISLALAKDPADRYATAGELARDVDLAINKQWHLRKLLV